MSGDQTVATVHPTPHYPVPTFPEWAVELAERIAALGQATGDGPKGDDEDRYAGPLFVGMIFRPAMSIGARTVGWRLSTVEEAKAWRSEYPDWWDLACVCGHTKKRHRNLWSDDDEIIGESCEDCDCASGSGSKQADR